jgi:membrane protease YdiL (CAAX protease family)
MQLNRFWSSVWSVASFLFGVGLLQYILNMVATLFGLLPQGPAMLIRMLVAVVVPIVGALTYVNWRWNWKPEHIGLPRTGTAVWHTLLGLLLGAAAAVLSAVVAGLLSGRGLTLSLPTLPTSTMALFLLIFSIPMAFTIELIFRGAVISRYQADLGGWEVLLAAALTPFGWLIIQRFFGFNGPPVGLETPGSMAMSVFLALLFVRTDSVWLSAGLRAGMTALAALLVSQSGGNGELVVWGVAAAVLLILEWLRQERMPKRVQPNRGYQRGHNRGRTVRGPWGPH